MVESHTISAPETAWQPVHQYAKENHTNISDVTRQAWKQFFDDQGKKYRIIDIIIIFLLLGITILIITVGWIL